MLCLVQVIQAEGVFSQADVHGAQVVMHISQNLPPSGILQQPDAPLIICDRHGFLVEAGIGGCIHEAVICQAIDVSLLHSGGNQAAFHPVDGGVVSMEQIQGGQLHHGGRAV